MNFDWNDEQQVLYENAVEFAREKLNGNMIEADRCHEFSRQKWQDCADFGLFGMPVPEAYGGLGMDTLTVARTLVGIGYGSKDHGLFLSTGAHLWAVETPLLLFASEAQKQAWLPKLVSGEWIGAHAASEPSAGSDIMGMVSRCEADGDHYILNGRKTWVTNAPVADVFIIFATVNPKLGFAGITGFFVEKDTPGLSLDQLSDKMGTRTSPMCDVVLDNVRVPVANRIGPVGLGYKIFSRIMQWERALIVAPIIGSMRRQMEESIHYANEREQFGKRLAANQYISGKIVDMQVRTEIAELLVYKAACQLDRGDATMASSIAKLWTTDAALQTYLDAVQIFGGYGYTTDFEIERQLRDVIGAKIYSGTTEMQKMLIATMLGLKTSNKD
jgi:alkylation response protein AidB-like acyl-CoA dehydrogenase